VRSFQHVEPPLRLYQGADSLRFLGRELERAGSRRAVILCGGTMSRDAALMELVRKATGERLAGVYPGVQAHSPVPAVEAAARELRRLEADAVIAIGGGSAVVTARAASILLAEAGDLASLSTSRDARGELRSPKLLAPKLPQLVIATTPNTAMTRVGSAVLDPVTGERRALFDPKTRAQALFIHPAFALSAPRELAVNASLNTFAFALEGLTSLTQDPMADAQLIHGLRLLVRALPDLELANSAEARGELLVGAVLCGQGSNATGAGLVTTLGHAIGTRHHVDNGIAMTIVLPHALRFNAEAIQPGLVKIATALDLPASDEAALLDAVLGAIAVFFGRVGVPSRLRDVGVPREALPGIAETGMDDWFLRGNPRSVENAAQLLDLLEEAW
jgi:alcohol dehydrogenase class IV